MKLKVLFLVGPPVKMPGPPLNDRGVLLERSALTVGSYGDEGSSGEEKDENNVTAEEKPTQRRQVVEPGGRVSVQRFMEESLKVSLASKRTNCP